MNQTPEMLYVTIARFNVLGPALVCGVIGLVVADDTPGTGDAFPAASATSVTGTGTITGKVVYTSDPERPWRLGRYYLRNAKSGELAEAVVAIHRRGLTGPEASRKSETVTIDQKDFQFTPETVAIRAGDRIRFVNSDAQVHNVQTNHDRQTFNVNMPSGGEHLEQFSYAGGIRKPYRIGCAFHGAMRSWIFVFDHPWFQLTGTDGAFRLVGVPPGEYRLDVAHPAGDLRTDQPITVKAGESVSVELRLSPDNQPKSTKP
jgi:plastocyanin